MKTYQQKLEMYDAAIDALVAGGVSSYTVAGRTFTKLDLSTLEKLRAYYAAKVQEEKGGFVTFSDMRGGNP